MALYGVLLLLFSQSFNLVPFFLPDLPKSRARAASFLFFSFLFLSSSSFVVYLAIAIV
jgi:hypothetical protein